MNITDAGQLAADIELLEFAFSKLPEEWKDEGSSALGRIKSTLTAAPASAKPRLADLLDGQGRVEEFPASAVEPVKVKPLEWETYNGDKSVGEQREHYGFHEFGYYVATKSDDAWSVGTFTNRGQTRFVGFYGTLADAKTGAQNDFDERVAPRSTSQRCGAGGVDTSRPME